jgi:hypothetical protein
MLTPLAPTKQDVLNISVAGADPQTHTCHIEVERIKSWQICMYSVSTWTTRIEEQVKQTGECVGDTPVLACQPSLASTAFHRAACAPEACMHSAHIHPEQHTCDVTAIISMVFTSGTCHRCPTRVM